MLIFCLMIIIRIVFLFYHFLSCLDTNFFKGFTQLWACEPALMGHVLSTEASLAALTFPKQSSGSSSQVLLSDACLWWGAPTVLAGGASVPGCHAQNNSLEEMRSQPWYVLLVSISASLRLPAWPGLLGGLSGWAMTKGKRFSCDWKGCWVSSGDAQSSGTLRPSTAGRLEGKDLTLQGWVLNTLPKPHPSPPPPFP